MNFQERPRSTSTTPLASENFVTEKTHHTNQLTAVRGNTGTDIHEVFKAYSILFDEVITRLPASGKLLTRIKQEYERATAIIQSRGQIEAKRHQLKVVKSCEVPTINNYHKRIKELDFKATKLRLDNERMKEEMAQMTTDIESIVREKEQRRRLLQSSAPRMTSAKRRSLGLSLEEATSVAQLEKELERVREELSEVRVVAERKYIPAQRKAKLRTLLNEKEEVKQQVDGANSVLAQQLKRVKLATQAVATYQSYLQQHRLDSSALPLEHYISAVIENNYEDVSDEEPDQDPAKEIEAEMVLDCFEKFNELFESERYEEAALHAASSPKGVLRTMDSLLKFKQSARLTPGCKPPLLCYCEALMQCAPAYRPLSKEEAIECVQCALDNDGIPLITHWIAQGVLYPSVDIGTLLLNHCKCTKSCACGCARTAFTVLDRCGEHKLAALCLVQQGKLMTFLPYARKLAFTKQDYVSMLCTRPSVALLEALTQSQASHDPPLNVIEGANILLLKGMAEEASRLIRKVVCEMNSHLLQPRSQSSDLLAQDDLWQNIIHHLHVSGFKDLAMEALSSITVHKAISGAVHNLTLDTNQPEEGRRVHTPPKSSYGTVSQSSVSSSEVTDSEYESSGGYSSELESDSPT